MKIILDKNEVIEIIKKDLINKFDKDVNIKIINRKNGFDVEAEIIEDKTNKTSWSLREVKGENKYPNVHIRVPAEISKVRKDRTSVGMRGDFFTRIKTYSNHTHSDDYIFSDMKTGEPLGKKVLYNMWHLIMRESGLGESLNDYTYY